MMICLLQFENNLLLHRNIRHLALTDEQTPPRKVDKRAEKAKTSNFFSFTGIPTMCKFLSFLPVLLKMPIIMSSFESSGRRSEADHESAAE